jgi:hypothetical protein
MSRGALHMCGVPSFSFQGFKTKNLLVSGSNFPLGQEKKRSKSQLRG